MHKNHQIIFINTFRIIIGPNIPATLAQVSFIQQPVVKQGAGRENRRIWQALHDIG